jgi:hypothetical protein
LATNGASDRPFNKGHKERSIMSEVILPNIMRERRSSLTIIRLVRVSGELVAVTVGMHRPDQSFRGTYFPASRSAEVFLSDSEFLTLKADAAGGTHIDITLTYESTTNRVTRFCFPSMSVPQAA